MENMEVVASQRQSAESYHNDDQLTDEVHLNYDRPNTDRDNGGCKDADVCDAKTGSSPNAAMGAAHNDNDGCELDMKTKNEVFGKNNLEHLTGTSVSSSETFKQHGEDSLNENTDIPQSLTDLCTVASTRESSSASTSTTTAADTSPEQLITSASGEQYVCSLRKSTRCRKRSLPAEPHSVCPNCGLSLKLSDLENHLQIEINKLEKLTKHRRSYDSVKKQKASATSSAPTEIMDCHTRYKQYLSVRTRRERRNKAKKQVKQPGDEEATCPVCNDRIIGTPDELTEHVDLCLQQQEANSDGELDVEGEDHFEEYTWAGQTRIRASSMLDGGLAGSGFAVAKQNCEDEDMELDIDGDVCSMFGNAQYTEADLIPCNDGEDGEEKERQALRKAVLRAEGYRSPGKPPPDRQRWQQNNDICKEKPGVSDCDTDRETSSSQSEVIESLKAKLKDQEAQLQKIERPKCLICMDWYTKPLTSIQCWHVHCEECWLRTLGTKKLCPQCNTITSASDLRRIYL